MSSGGVCVAVRSALLWGGWLTGWLAGLLIVTRSDKKKTHIRRCGLVGAALLLLEFFFC